MASVILFVTLLVSIVYGWPLWAIVAVAVALLLSVIAEVGDA